MNNADRLSYERNLKKQYQDLIKNRKVKKKVNEASIAIDTIESLLADSDYDYSLTIICSLHKVK